jgi:hypothetical protein
MVRSQTLLLKAQVAVTEDHELDRQVENSDADDWARAIAGGSEEVVGEFSP